MLFLPFGLLENAVDKKKKDVIMRLYEKRQYVDEKSRMRKGHREGSQKAGSFLLRNHLKTTSEWLQNSPVIPLSSVNEVVLAKASSNRVEPRE